MHNKSVVILGTPSPSPAMFTKNGNDVDLSVSTNFLAEIVQILKNKGWTVTNCSDLKSLNANHVEILVVWSSPTSTEMIQPKLKAIANIIYLWQVGIPNFHPALFFPGYKNVIPIPVRAGMLEDFQKHLPNLPRH